MIIGSAKRGRGGSGVRGEGEEGGRICISFRRALSTSRGAHYIFAILSKKRSRRRRHRAARERRNKCASHPPSSVISIIELTRMVYGTKFSMVPRGAFALARPLQGILRSDWTCTRKSWMININYFCLPPAARTSINNTSIWAPAPYAHSNKTITLPSKRIG